MLCHFLRQHHLLLIGTPQGAQSCFYGHPRCIGSLGQKVPTRNSTGFSEML
jgi:hypothetical protein